MKRYMIIFAAIVLGLSACGKKDDSATAAKGRGNDDRQAVMVESLSLRDVDEYVTVSGKLEGITDIVMSSESSGRLMELNKKLGDTVQAGDRIGRVENEVSRIRVEQAEAAFSSGESALQNARKNLDYAEIARAQNLISEAEYNTAISAFKGAKAGYDGANAALEAARQAYNNSYLVAPAKGKISYLHVAVGQFVSQGMPIANITDGSTLILKTGVGESQIAKLREGQIADISYQGKNYQGRVRGFGIRPMAGSANYPLEISVSPGSALLPGMVVRAQIKTNTYRNLLYTSITNVAKEYDKNYLWVLNSGEGDKQIASRREVQLGRSIGQFVEIISGAEIGDVIVISGSENLEDGSPVKIRQ
jgi:RND family efflux transporter MFP subunit